MKWFCNLLYRKPLILAALVHVSVTSLNCFYCYSPNSWEDCRSKEKTFSCGAQQDCLIFHRKITPTKGEKLQEFVKTCYPTSLCARGMSECYESENGKVTWCDMRCCKTNGCNKEMNSTQTQGSSHSQGNNTGSANQSLPVFVVAATNSRKKSTINSTKRKAIETIPPRAVFYQRHNTEKRLYSSLYVTVAMVVMSLVVARQYS